MSDLINRQDAIDAIKNIIPTKEGFIEPEEAIEELTQIPSAQPDKDIIHLQKEQAYMQGWEDGRKALREEIWEDGRDRLD